MARGINKVILVGNLGQDPEVRYMPNGNAVVNFSVATSESWKDKTTGERQDRTEWHRIVMFNRLAEIVRDYVKKGSKVYVEGSLRTRKWQDQNGQDRYTTEIVGSELQMLDSRMGGDNMGYQQPQQQQAAPQAPYGGGFPDEPMQQQQAAPAAANAPTDNSFDDEIPF